jgi:hypothetical protein
MNPHRTTHRLTQVLGALLLSASALAQTHKVAAPESVVRAVAIYEWTGEMAKPAASRLIPVSLFIDGKLEDADVYLARPIPLALMPGNVYELDQSGIALGTLNLAFARHLIPASDAAAPYDDGWFGYGKFFPPEQPKKSTLKGSKENISLDEYDDTPHFSARSAEPGSGEAAKPASGKPVEGDAPADDPNRPTLHRSTSTTASSGTADQPSSSDAKDPSDPDRPTLRRRSPTVAAASATPSQADEIAALNDEARRSAQRRRYSQARGPAQRRGSAPTRRRLGRQKSFAARLLPLLERRGRTQDHSGQDAVHGPNADRSLRRSQPACTAAAGSSAQPQQQAPPRNRAGDCASAACARAAALRDAA